MQNQAVTNGRTRERYLDLVKVIGAISIVALHTLSNTINAGGYITDMQYMIKHVLHQFFYAAVPVFLLASGAGFLGDGKVKTYGNMKRHILKLLACILVFGTGFTLMRLVANGEAIRVKEVIYAVLSNHTWSHMWYLYKLFGIYLCMPLLSTFVMNTSRRDQWRLMCLLVFFFGLYPFVAGNLGFVPVPVMPFNGIWFFYFLMGSLLGRTEADSLKRWKWFLAAGTLLGIGVVLWQGLHGAILGEDNPGEILLSVCLFADAKLLCAGKESGRSLAFMAGNSLGIYILHPMLIHICVRLLKFNPWGTLPVLTLPMMVLGIYLATLAITAAIRQIPPIRKYLL